MYETVKITQVEAHDFKYIDGFMSEIYHEMINVLFYCLILFYLFFISNFYFFIIVRPFECVVAKQNNESACMTARIRDDSNHSLQYAIFLHIECANFSTEETKINVYCTGLCHNASSCRFCPCKF